MGGHFCAKNIDISAVKYEEYFRRAVIEFQILH